MTKDVLIAIEGLQFTDNPDGEKIEVITPGSYYKRNNHHYVLYDEVGESSEEVTKNTVKYDGNILSITKRGFTNVDMVFEKNKRNMTNYITPFGNLLVGIDADRVDVVEDEDNIRINVDYALDINYEHFADCKIRMDIKSKTQEAIEELELSENNC